MSGNFLGMDMSEVNELAADLILASVKALPAVRTVIEVGSYKIKDEARDTIRALDNNNRLPAYPSSITYDVDVNPIGIVSGEIGPDKDRPQGPLGNVLEYGTSISRPVPHLQPALENEVTAVQVQLAALAHGVLITKRHP